MEPTTHWNNWACRHKRGAFWTSGLACGHKHNLGLPYVQDSSDGISVGEGDFGKSAKCLGFKNFLLLEIWQRQHNHPNVALHLLLGLSCGIRWSTMCIRIWVLEVFRGKAVLSAPPPANKKPVLVQKYIPCSSVRDGTVYLLAQRVQTGFIDAAVMWDSWVIIGCQLLLLIGGFDDYWLLCVKGLMRGCVGKEKKTGKCVMVLKS